MFFVIFLPKTRKHLKKEGNIHTPLYEKERKKTKNAPMETTKKHILTSVWSAQHPNAVQNTQQSLVLHLGACIQQL